MIFNPSFPDVGVVTNWYADTKKNALKFIKNFPEEGKKCPLLLAALQDSQLEHFKEPMEADGWKPVAYYPSCHGGMGRGYNVWLYAKEYKVPLAPTKNNSMSGGLHCSVVVSDKFTRRPTSWYSTAHGVLGLRRVPHSTKSKVFTRASVGPWWKFAETELASYWVWGLKPDEKDIFKLEPSLRPKEGK